MRTIHLAAFLSLLLLSAHVPAAHAHEILTADLSKVQRASFANAVQAFRDHRYATAYARFTRLADAGHVPSAQLALVMYRHGTALFRSDWYATPDQQMRWNALVINSARSRIEFAEDAGGD